MKYSNCLFLAPIVVGDLYDLLIPHLRKLADVRGKAFIRPIFTERTLDDFRADRYAAIEERYLEIVELAPKKEDVEI